MDFVICTHHQKTQNHKYGRMERMEHSEKSMKKKHKKGHKIKSMKPVFTNPWPYAEKLPALMENMKVTKDDLCTIECRNEYTKNSKTDLTSEHDNNDEPYHIFGKCIDKDTKFR